ncbi:MAG: hypothetical protein VW405_03140 [Rhodospirillaceae bacterium]
MAQAPSEVVVIDSDGTQHVFPPGFDRARAEEIVRAGRVDTQAPAVAPRARTWIDTAVDLLPAAGATVGGVLGGATGIPTLGAGSVPGAMIGAATLGAGGESLRQLINRYRGVPTPATPGDAARDIAKEAIIGAAGEGVGRFVMTPAMNWGARRFMQSALKPPFWKVVQDVKQGAQPQVVQTLLDEGVNVSTRGLGTLREGVGATNTQIANAIASAPGEVSGIRVAGRLSPTTREFIAQVNPGQDMQAISNAGIDFLQHPWLSPRGTLTPTQAQAMKVGTYARIGEKYGKVSSAAIEAEKALARGLKEELEKAVPGIDLSALNAREGRLIDAMDAVSRRIAVASNRDPVGFAWVTVASQQPGHFIAALMDRSPIVKSLIARGFYNEAGKVSRVPGKAIEVAVRALQQQGEEQ